MNHGLCASCGAQILWAETEGGGIISLDAGPAAGGNVALVDGRARILSGGLFDQATPGDRYYPHFRSCPAQAAWRRKRRQAR